MTKYTIEDVEILRQKSGISYEEAVNLLEYHNGSLARALVDLEKNGRLKNEPRSSSGHKGWKGIFDFLFHLRLQIKKKHVMILNISSLFALLLLATAPHICIIGLIISLVLGYRISIDRDSSEFMDDHFDDMVKNAKTNVRSTIDAFTHQFTGNEEQTKANAQTESSGQRAESAASGTRPVNVQFPNEGKVNVRDDGDGYHEADIH